MHATIQALRAVATPAERRRHRRVPVALRGRLLDERGAESACRALDASVGGALLRLEAEPPEVGAALIVYLDRLGRMPATVVRRVGPIAAVRFTASPAKRERMVEALTFVHNAARLGLADERREARFAGAGPVIVTPEQGPSFAADLLDISLVGASVQSAPETMPRIGSWVRIGQTWGRVARPIEGGFAVDFQPRGVRLQDDPPPAPPWDLTDF